MRLLSLYTSLFVFGLCAIPAVSQISLEWPVACQVGSTCEIQHYVDHGDGALAKDYRCGTVTYKGHNGTDIRVLTLADERRGVNVLAAASGRVLRTRDGMADVSVAIIGHDAIKDRDCGNGLVIGHADGFETQYCHMAQGSLVVKAGETVVAGQSIGRVGLSGDTEFPHLHITVRHDAKIVDPFAYGAPEGACNGGVSLWSPAVQPMLGYKAGTVLNAGISPRPLTMDDVDNGLGQEHLKTDSPVVLAYVRAITLRLGDVQRIVLTGPGGPLLDHSEPPLSSNKDQAYLMVGRKRPVAGWPPGLYTATYTVTRDGQVVVERTFSSQVGS